MSTKNLIVKAERPKLRSQNPDRHETGYVYLKPKESYKPTKAHTSDITLDAVVYGRRTPKSVDRYSSVSVEPPSSRSTAAHNPKHERPEAASAARRSSSQSTTRVRKRTGKTSKKKAAFYTFPNLQPARTYQSGDVQDDPKSDPTNHESQEVESVTIYDDTSGALERERLKQTTKCVLGSNKTNLAGIDVPKLAMELVNIQANAKGYAKKNRTVKRQYRLWLDVQAREMEMLDAELGDLRTKNEELLRQLDQTRPSNRRVSQVNYQDTYQLESQGKLIRDLKAKFYKSCRINQFMDSPARNTWSRGPLESGGKLIQIQKSIIRLTNSLEGLILDPGELEKSVKGHEKGPAVVELLARSFGDINLLLDFPWLALRSFLFRFVREHVFYSDLWASVHCDGLVVREYQRAIELCAPEGFLETFHADTFYELIDDADFKECILRPHREDVRGELMELLIPLMNSVGMKEKAKDIEGQADSMIEHAFDLRVTCIPARGERFEITHYQPGDLFDPENMRVENSEGQNIIPPNADKIQHRVKLCVQGSMKIHSAEDTARGIDFLNIMAQPFVEPPEGDRSNGKLISEKACVILDM